MEDPFDGAFKRGFYPIAAAQRHASYFNLNPFGAQELEFDFSDYTEEDRRSNARILREGNIFDVTCVTPDGDTLFMYLEYWHDSFRGRDVGLLYNFSFVGAPSDSFRLVSSRLVCMELQRLGIDVMPAIGPDDVAAFLTFVDPAVITMFGVSSFSVLFQFVTNYFGIGEITEN